MKVKLKMSSGLGRYGQIVEIEDALGRTLIANGTAEAVGAAPAPPPPAAAKKTEES